MQNYGFNEFCAYQRNFNPTVPGTSDGVSVSPGGSNVMGSWTDLMGGTVAEDSFGIWINVADGQQGSGTTGAKLMDIGIDYGGGTSYTVLIPYLGFSGEVNTGSTQWRGALFYFPVFMPKGSRLGARIQAKNSTPTTVTVKAKLAQKPSRPGLIRYGTYVDAIGADPTNSRGTVYVPGNSAWGSWVSLGTSLREAWFCVPAFINDVTSSTNNCGMADFATGNTTSKLTLLPQFYYAHHGSDEVVTGPEPDEMGFHQLPAGSTFYVRAQEHGVPDSNYTAILYLVGGG